MENFGLKPEPEHFVPSLHWHFLSHTTLLFY